MCNYTKNIKRKKLMKSKKKLKPTKGKKKKLVTERPKNGKKDFRVSPKKLTFTESEGKFACCKINYAVKHKDQRRKNQAATPYINHPIGVAHILTHEGNINDLNVIQAAILHDTVEDTNTTFEELEINFGHKVTDIVRECTDDKNLPKNERKRLQIVNAKNSSMEAKLVKLADKLYNLRDLDTEIPVGWSEQRVSEYFDWAYKVFEGLKGTNEAIEQKLLELFRKHNVTMKH